MLPVADDFENKAEPLGEEWSRGTQAYSLRLDKAALADIARQGAYALALDHARGVFELRKGAELIRPLPATAIRAGDTLTLWDNGIVEVNGLAI